MQSMTGYGRGLICEDGWEMTVEAKASTIVSMCPFAWRGRLLLDDAMRTGIAARLARAMWMCLSIM
ncbi:MAG: hypothetical protein ACLUI3_11995 [Christensenellales bacterium]